MNELGASFNAQYLLYEVFLNQMKSEGVTRLIVISEDKSGAIRSFEYGTYNKKHPTKLTSIPFSQKVCIMH